MGINFGINESSLVRLCKNGDAKAQHHFYKLHAKAMYNLSVRMTNGKEAAEDILQDAFIKAFSEINNLKDEKAFGGWLKRIVINCCLDEIRRRKVIYSGFETITERHVEMAVDIDELVDPEIVHHLIKKLPDGAREILVLRAIEGYKHAEIAEKLNISESTVKTQFFRAKQLLGKMINERNYEFGHRKISEKKTG
ncbi:MAG: RNA polymerase sigma factor [Draconibacterium sp.]|nr:RNA polymerase sigma factor [Draconibacterium sp.]